MSVRRLNGKNWREFAEIGEEMTESLRHARVCVYRIARRALRRARALIHELGFETDLFVLPLRRLDRVRAGIAEEFALAVGDGFDGDGAETRVNLQSSVRVALGAGGVLLRRRAFWCAIVDASTRAADASLGRLGARQRSLLETLGEAAKKSSSDAPELLRIEPRSESVGFFLGRAVPIEG